MTQAPQINQSEINDILWRACDTFRGTVDPAEYKNYILVMLFVKYISDVWRDRYDQLVEKYGGDEDRAWHMMRYEKFILPEGCDFQSLYRQRNAPNLGEIINIALEKIEETNKEKLEGVFRNIDYNSEAALGRTRSATRGSRTCSTTLPTRAWTCAPPVWAIWTSSATLTNT
jgi:type I restriction enzyme M protein